MIYILSIHNYYTLALSSRVLLLKLQVVPLEPQVVPFDSQMKSFGLHVVLLVLQVLPCGLQMVQFRLQVTLLELEVVPSLTASGSIRAANSTSWVVSDIRTMRGNMCMVQKCEKPPGSGM